MPKYFFGFTPDFGGVDDPILSAYYKHMKTGGAKWVRFGVYWWYIEKSPGVYTWYSTDRYFAAIGLQWPARSPDVHRRAFMGVGKTSTIAPPTQTYLPEYKTMIRAVIARYGVGGSYWSEGHHCADGTAPVPASPSSIWQVWNEPNVMSDLRRPNGHGPGLRPASRSPPTTPSTHPSIPTAQTVMGGLTGSKASDFLTALYTAVPDLNSHVDIFDVHAYATTPLEMPSSS